MTYQQIGCIIDMLKECGKEITVGSVYEIIRLIGETASIEHIERAIALKKSQDQAGWIF